MSDSRHSLVTSEQDSSHKSRIPKPLGRKSLQRSQSLKASSERWSKADYKGKPNLHNNFDSPFSIVPRHQRQNGSFSLSNSELASVTSTPLPAFHDADELCSLKSFGSACGVFSLDGQIAGKSIHVHPHYHKGKKNILHCQTQHETQLEYLTPTQRQAREVRHLKAMLLKTQKALGEKSNDLIQIGKELVELRLEKESNKKQMLNESGNDNNQTELSPILSKSCDSGHFEQSECSDNCIKDDDVDNELNVAIRTEAFSTASNKSTYEKNNIEEYYRHQLEEVKRLQVQEYQEQKEKYNDKIENLLVKLNEANIRYFDLRPQLDRSHDRIRKLESQICLLQEEKNEQEKRHHQMYLKMYKKGQEAARFEHADEVLEFAHQAPNRTSVPELLQQLHTTEHELERMKNLYRHELCKKVDGVKDAEVTLRFLKDALFYFLTDKDNLGHLQAIESIMGYSEMERISIERSLLSRHKLFK